MGNKPSILDMKRKQNAETITTATTTTFPLLRLPPELRDLVYEQHYGDTLLHMCDCLDSLECHGHPSLALELACHEVSAAAKNVREKCFNSHLVIVAKSFFDRIDEFCDPRFFWLRHHIRSVELILPNEPSSDVSWSRLLSFCPNLCEVHLTVLDRICPDHDLDPVDQLEDDDGQLIDIVTRTDLDVKAVHRLPVKTRDLAQAFVKLGRSEWKIQALVSLRLSRCGLLESGDDEEYVATVDIVLGCNIHSWKPIERACSTPTTYAYWSQDLPRSTLATIDIGEARNRHNQKETTLALSLTEQGNIQRWVAERTRPRVVRNDEEVDERIERQFNRPAITSQTPQKHLRKLMSRMRSVLHRQY